MLSFLSVLLSLVSAVMKYIDRNSIENAGRAKAIVEAWERNNGFVTSALAAGDAKRRELAADSGKLREHDEDERPD